MSLLKIVDVSAYQGTTVPAVDVVFVKATEGSGYTSGRFTAQWRSAAARAKHRGAYHFARPEASSAKSQCDRFLDVVQPVVGESAWLDLEASGLNQAKTHAWAVDWADRFRDQAPGVTYGIYLGSGYATNNTGKGLAAEYPYWWFPQYPSAYQLAHVDVEALRAANRTAAVEARTPIAAMTTRWPPAADPWLPSGLTFGKPRPDIWQFTDNWNGLDASVSALTLEQLAGGGRPAPLEEDVTTGNFKLTADDPKFPIELNGKYKQIRFWCDNSYKNADHGIEAAPQQSLRVAVLDTAGKVLQVEDFLVGRTEVGSTTPPAWINFKSPAKSEALGITQGSKGPCDQRISFSLA